MIEPHGRRKYCKRLEPTNPKIIKPVVIEQRGQVTPQYPNLDDEAEDEE